MELGKDVAEETLQARIDNLAPNKCCTLIYTVSLQYLSSHTADLNEVPTCNSQLHANP